MNKKKNKLQAKWLLRALSGNWLYRLQWRDRYYLTKEQALLALKSETGQDFAYDVKAWRKWFDENPDFEFKSYSSPRNG